MIIGLAPISILAFITYIKFSSINELLLSEGDPVLVFEQITSLLFDVSVSMMIVFVGYALVAFLSAFIVSHQVAGASVAILRYIDEMKKGNYSYQRTLRKNDALVPIMDSLKELSSQLQKEKGQ